MSVLPRPELIEFDPENKDHRFEFFYFLSNGKWRKGAPRFKPDIARGYQSVPQLIFAKIAERALMNEFGSSQASGDVDYHPV